MRTIRIALLDPLATVYLAVDRCAAQAPHRATGGLSFPSAIIACCAEKRIRRADSPTAAGRRHADPACLRPDAGGEAVTGTATADVDVLKEGWVTVMIPAGLLVRDAESTAVPSRSSTIPTRISCCRSSDDRSSRCRSSCRLRPSAPPNPSSSLRRRPAVEATFRFRAMAWMSLCRTASYPTKARPPASSRWTAHGRANQPLTFTWRRRVDDQRATQPLRVRGAVTELVGLGEESTQITATAQLEVIQGLARTLTLAVPERRGDQPGLRVRWWPTGM